MERNGTTLPVPVHVGHAFSCSCSNVDVKFSPTHCIQSCPQILHRILKLLNKKVVIVCNSCCRSPTISDTLRHFQFSRANLYQKGERALPGNLHNRCSEFLPVITAVCLVIAPLISLSLLSINVFGPYLIHILVLCFCTVRPESPESFVNCHLAKYKKI
jgi:hypothetical protein